MQFEYLFWWHVTFQWNITLLRLWDSHYSFGEIHRNFRARWYQQWWIHCSRWNALKDVWIGVGNILSNKLRDPWPPTIRFRSSWGLKCVCRRIKIILTDGFQSDNLIKLSRKNRVVRFPNYRILVKIQVLFTREVSQADRLSQSDLWQKSKLGSRNNSKNNVTYKSNECFSNQIEYFL